MQINIKLKFDPKKCKNTTPWNQSHKPFFLENTQFKNKQRESELQPVSFRDCQQMGCGTDREHLQSFRQYSKDFHTMTKTSLNISKKSKHKPSKDVNQSSRRKSSLVKKTMSNVIKVPKRKLSIISNSKIKQQQSLKGSLPGLSGKKVLQRFAPLLSQNQKIQLINQKTVYYVGIGAIPGQDDENGSYLWKKHEQVGYRYQLLECLGSGAFGEVIKAFDHKNKETVAIKIIRSKKQHMQLALNEINILMRLKQKDIENEKNIVRIKDFIVFRRHICIVTQLLSISLYELMHLNGFREIQMNYLRTFAIQILTALTFLKENNVIHSDLKPENILLKNKSKTGLKLIDFGTSMFSHEATYMYIQSRFYRAPQVLLGLEYDQSIDMWSFGCLMAELHLGEPLFAGNNEQQQLNLIIQAIGEPPKQSLMKSKNLHNYYREDMKLKKLKTKNGQIFIPNSKPLSIIIHDKYFAQFLSKIFVYNPRERLKPLDALLDPWILDGLPESIRQQHQYYVKMKLKKYKNDIMEFIDEKKTPTKTNSKKHRKRNSDFCGNQKTSGHKRRRSDGVM